MSTTETNTGEADIAASQARSAPNGKKKTAVKSVFLVSEIQNRESGHTVPRVGSTPSATPATSRDGFGRGLVHARARAQARREALHWDALARVVVEMVELRVHPLHLLRVRRRRSVGRRRASCAGVRGLEGEVDFSRRELSGSALTLDASAAPAPEPNDCSGDEAPIAEPPIAGDSIGIRDALYGQWEQEGGAPWHEAPPNRAQRCSEKLSPHACALSGPALRQGCGSRGGARCAHGPRAQRTARTLLPLIRVRFSGRFLFWTRDGGACLPHPPAPRRPPAPANARALPCPARISCPFASPRRGGASSRLEISSSFLV